MTWGDRKSERVHLEHRHDVNLMGVDGTWRRKCILLDVSATGARLEVEGTLDVLRAGEFFLLLSSTGLAYRRCELIRVDGGTVGVRFILEKERRGARSPRGERSKTPCP